MPQVPSLLNAAVECVAVPGPICAVAVTLCPGLVQCQGSPYDGRDLDTPDALESKKTMQAVGTCPTSIKEKGPLRAKAPCYPIRRKRNWSMGIRRVASSAPFLTLAMSSGTSFLKSASGT